MVGGGVPGLGAFKAALLFAVDGPFDGVGGPVDLVGVVCAEGVLSADIEFVAVCGLLAMVDMEGSKIITIGDALKIVVGLSSVEVGANEFKVDFVLDIRKEDKCRNHTRCPACLECSCYFPIPHVGCARQQCTNAALGHG